MRQRVFRTRSNDADGPPHRRIAQHTSPICTTFVPTMPSAARTVLVRHSEIVTIDDDAESIRRLAGLATPMARRVAVTLGLPVRLVGEGLSVDELAAEIKVDAVALDLLLGHLATLGVVERTSIGCWRTTEYGASACTDAGNGLADLLHFDAAGGRAELAFVELAHSITTGQAAYPRRYGQDFWADLAEYPHLRELFDRQMTNRFRNQIPLIVAGFDWSRFSNNCRRGWPARWCARRDPGCASSDIRSPGRS